MLAYITPTHTFTSQPGADVPLVSGFFTEEEMLTHQDQSSSYEESTAFTAACMLRVLFPEIGDISYNNGNESYPVEVLDHEHAVVGIPGDTGTDVVQYELPQDLSPCNSYIEEDLFDTEELSEDELLDECYHPIPESVFEPLPEEEPLGDEVIIRAMVDPEWFFKSEAAKRIRSSEIFKGIPKSTKLRECVCEGCTKSSDLCDLKQPWKTWCPAHHPEIARRNLINEEKRMRVFVNLFGDSIYTLENFETPKKEYIDHTVVRSWFAFRARVVDADLFIENYFNESLSEWFGFEEMRIVAFIQKV